MLGKFDILALVKFRNLTRNLTVRSGFQKKEILAFGAHKVIAGLQAKRRKQKCSALVIFQFKSCRLEGRRSTCFAVRALPVGVEFTILDLRIRNAGAHKLDVQAGLDAFGALVADSRRVLLTQVDIPVLHTHPVVREIAIFALGALG